MTAQPTGKLVLLVEDNPDDVFIMRRVFQKEKIAASLEIKTDGKQAIEYLKNAMQERAAMPRFAFLDLKLPYLNGFDILEWIREQPKLAQMPVVILTSSLEDKDRARADAMGVHYLVKPPTAQMICEVLDVLDKD